MKKMIMLFWACMTMIVSVYADSNQGTSSCNVQEIPGAYIYATVNASSERYVIKVNAYGVKEGIVEVEFDWKKEGESGQEKKLVAFRDGKGEVNCGYSTNNRYERPTISNVRVYNPICKPSK